MSESSPENLQERKSITERSCIAVDELLSLMVHALVPLRSEASGIECIATVVIPMPKKPGEETLWMPLRIQGKLKSQLEALLSDLPPLRFPMSAEEEEQFIQRYMLLPHRPGWVPVLLQKAELEGDMELRYAYSLRLRKELIGDPDFHPFDEQHNPLPPSAQHAYLDSGLAERILRKRGLLQKANGVLTSFGGRIPFVTPVLRQPSSSVTYPGFPKELVYGGSVSQATLDMWRRSFEGKRSKAQPARGVMQRAASAEIPPEPKADVLEIDLGGDTRPTDSAKETSRRRSSSDHSSPARVQNAAAVPDVPTHNERSLSAALTATPDGLPELLSAEQVAKLIGVKSDQTVRNRVNPAMGKSYDPSFPKPREVAGTLRWVKQEILAYISSRPTKS
jgi:predicted DNA-binding transcriptional regulator AlpA